MKEVSMTMKHESNSELTSDMKNEMIKAILFSTDIWQHQCSDEIPQINFSDHDKHNKKSPLLSVPPPPAYTP